MVNGPGVFEISFSPADGSGKLTTEVFEFTGTGGVTMGMYNTDEVTIEPTYWLVIEGYVWVLFEKILLKKILLYVLLFNWHHLLHDFRSIEYF